MQVEPSGDTVPTKSRFTGEVVDPAVVGSTTTMSLPVATAALLVNAIGLGGCAAGKITNETGFERIGGVPGF